jgi:hypothetical protein
VELAQIEAFLTLCEELHFGRTAERLRDELVPAYSTLTTAVSNARATARSPGPLRLGFTASTAGPPLDQLVTAFERAQPWPARRAFRSRCSPTAPCRTGSSGKWPPEWGRRWSPSRTPSGQPVLVYPMPVRTVSEAISLIARKQAVLPTMSLHRFDNHGIVHVPIHDLPTVPLRLAWWTANENARTPALAQVASDLRHSGRGRALADLEKGGHGTSG